MNEKSKQTMKINKNIMQGDGKILDNTRNQLLEIVITHQNNTQQGENKPTKDSNQQRQRQGKLKIKTSHH